jgi:hypothetical protein
MRGDNPNATHMFSYNSPEQRVPADHPLRPIRQMTDAALQALSPRFDQHAFEEGVSGSCPARDTSRRKRPATLAQLLKEIGDLKIELDFTADGKVVTSSMIHGERVRQMPQDWKFEGGKVVIGAKTLELDGKLLRAAYLRKP